MGIAKGSKTKREYFTASSEELSGGCAHAGCIRAEVRRQWADGLNQREYFKGEDAGSDALMHYGSGINPYTSYNLSKR